MTNDRKLELTLCGMLPYELKVNAPFLGTTDRSITTLRPIAVSQLISGERSITPLLHSLDKLTEPILDGGLIPIVELAKISTEKNTAELYEDSEIISIRIANKSHNLLRFCYSKKNNDFYKTINGAEIPCKNQLELFEKLKEWHFNIYDLPKEMYIEKSNHQLLK